MKHQLPHLLPPSCLCQEQRWTASTIPWGNGKNRSCSASFYPLIFILIFVIFIFSARPEWPCLLPQEEQPQQPPRARTYEAPRKARQRGIFLQCVRPASCGLSCNLASFPSPWGCEITQASFSYFVQNFSFIFLWRPDLAMTHLYWDWM